MAVTSPRLSKRMRDLWIEALVAEIASQAIFLPIFERDARMRNDGDHMAVSSGVRSSRKVASWRDSVAMNR